RLRALGLEHDLRAGPDPPHAEPERGTRLGGLVHVDERRGGRRREGGGGQQRGRRQDLWRRRGRGRRRQRLQADRRGQGGGDGRWWSPVGKRARAESGGSPGTAPGASGSSGERTGPSQQRPGNLSGETGRNAGERAGPSQERPGSLSGESERGRLLGSEGAG